MTTTTTIDPLAGQATGQESSLSTWVGPYVTDMLGRGKALADSPYQAYQGPLTAGTSNLQNQAFSGLANLASSGPTFTPQSFSAEGTAQQHMNPYLQSALQPQVDELTRQNEIQKQNIRSDLSKAGAYGGSRQAVMESEANRNLNTQIAQTLGRGYADAYTQGANQFNTEQGLGLQAANQNYGQNLQGLGALMNAGQMQRDIDQQGMVADYKQFEQERMDPYKQTQFMQSLLQGLPLGAQSYSYQAPSAFNQFMGTAGGLGGLLGEMFGSGGTGSTGGTGGTGSTGGTGG